MKWNLKLHLSLACVVVTGVTSFAFGQSAEYIISPPLNTPSGSIVMAQFFTNNPFKLQTSTRNTCDSQNSCKYVDQSFTILDCTNKDAKCGSEPLEDKQDFGSGYAHVALIKGHSREVGWIPATDLLPLQSPNEKKPCIPCTQTGLEKLKSYSHDILFKTQTKKPETSSNSVVTLLNNSKCNDFINPDGKYGEWGRTLLHELTQHPSMLQKSAAVNRICPNFGKFEIRKKYDFFVSIFASLAAGESSCKEKVVSPIYLNPNKAAYGLFQLEGQNALLKSRDKTYHENSCVTAAKKVDSNIKCAVAILNYQLAQGYDLFSDKSYWATLHLTPVKVTDPNSGKVITTKPWHEQMPAKMGNVYPGCWASGLEGHSHDN